MLNFLSLIHWFIGFIFGISISLLSSGILLEVKLSKTLEFDLKKDKIDGNFISIIILLVSILSLISYFFNAYFIQTTAKVALCIYLITIFFSVIFLIKTVIYFREGTLNQNITLILRIIVYISLIALYIYILKIANHPLSFELIKLFKNIIPNISNLSIWIVSYVLAVSFNLLIFITVIQVKIENLGSHKILSVYGTSNKNWLLYLLSSLIVFIVTIYPQEEVLILSNQSELNWTLRCALSSEGDCALKINRVFVTR